MMALSHLICFYFLLGMRHWETLMLLNVGAINSSMSSTMSRHLKSVGLFRRKSQSDLLEVALFLQEQLNQFFNQSRLFVTCNHTRYNHSDM